MNGLIEEKVLKENDQVKRKRDGAIDSQAKDIAGLVDEYILENNTPMKMEKLDNVDDWKGVRVPKPDNLETLSIKRNFIGSIGSKSNIFLELCFYSIENKFYGRYKYEESKGWYDVRGSQIKKKNKYSLELKSYRNGLLMGKFSGSYANKVLSGVWSPDYTIDSISFRFIERNQDEDLNIRGIVNCSKFRQIKIIQKQKRETTPAEILSLGIKYFEQREFDLAIPNFIKVLKKEAQNKVAFKYLKDSYIRTESYGSALRLDAWKMEWMEGHNKN